MKREELVNNAISLAIQNAKLVRNIHPKAIERARELEEAARLAKDSLLRHIEEQDAENARLREALERIGEVKSVHFTESCDCGWCQCVRMARAALKEAQGE
jgi:hypothetical protein